MHVRLFTLFFCLALSLKTFAQLTPPGLGETNSAFWSAIGVSQKLDKKNTSKTYFGTGYISGTVENNPFNAPSIVVLNQEFYHKINSKWQYSYALSYRRQHEYDEEFAGLKEAGVKQEFRVYGRLGYTTHIGSLKWATALRQEVRKFYSGEFANVPDALQLRTRLKTQFTVPLDSEIHNSIIGSAEILFAMANDKAEGWNRPDYSPEDYPVILDIGYMNDLIGYGDTTTDVSYLAMDIIIKDPFN